MELVRVSKRHIDKVRELLLKAQNYQCAICRRPFNQRDYAVVDHDHFTGIVRGVIHNTCNMTEGNIVTEARMCHKGVGQHEYLIGLAGYLVWHETPRTIMIHPSHHMPNERKGVPKWKRNWRTK